jgi:hypothetical protein
MTKLLTGMVKQALIKELFQDDPQAQRIVNESNTEVEMHKALDDLYSRRSRLGYAKRVYTRRNCINKELRRGSPNVRLLRNIGKRARRNVY